MNIKNYLNLIFFKSQLLNMKDSHKQYGLQSTLYIQDIILPIFSNYHDDHVIYYWFYF